MSNILPKKFTLLVAALVFITITREVLLTRAKTCNDGQHCEECNTTSSTCITECFVGYYDQQCSSVCSGNCKQQKCKTLENVGIGYCTEGCEPGYQGANCELGCFVPTENCSICPGGCEGEYCYQGHTCFSGCHDNNFGSDCKNCSSRCESCNVTTGTCNHCHLPYHGQNCEFSCNNCSGSCEAGCVQVCAPGLYGNACTEMCSESCHSYPAIHSEEQCLNISNLCTPECHRESGDCISGCVSCVTGNQRRSSIILYVAALIVVMLVATAVCYICYRKDRSSTRFTYQEEATYSHNMDEREEEENYPPDANVAATPKQRNSEHIYHEIDTNEMGPVIVFL